MQTRLRPPSVAQALFLLRLSLAVGLSGLLPACSTFGNHAASLPAPPGLAVLLPTPVLLLGEQHEAPGQPELQEGVVRQLSDQGLLAALLLEMAERGHDTRGLPAQASEAEVQAALAWPPNWPWSRYGPTVMSAVRAGVPVFGANLPRSAMRAHLQDSALDASLDPISLRQQHENIRQGHCNLLPENQIPGMARIQIARDRSMAETVVSAWRPGQTVVVLAGNEHVRSDLGIPRHLTALSPPWPASAGPVRPVRMQARSAAPHTVPTHNHQGMADTVWATPTYPERDHCAELRQQWQRR